MTKQEVESTAETLEGERGMGKLYNYIISQKTKLFYRWVLGLLLHIFKSLSSIQNLNQNNSECILRFHFCFSPGLLLKSNHY